MSGNGAMNMHLTNRFGRPSNAKVSGAPGRPLEGVVITGGKFEFNYS